MSNSNIKYLKISSQNKEIRADLISAFEDVLDSGIYISSSRVAKFEESYSAAIDVPYTVACNSGTSALILSLQALGIRPGDEILVPSMTFIATIEAVISAGGTPVIVDVDQNTWNLDVNLVKEKISPNTKALIFVHLHGNPAGILEAKQFCDENGLFLIEDAAQAHLAEISGKKIGGIGDVAAFSFYPGKNLGALGEGGCLTTKSEALYEKAKLLRNWGSKEKYVHEIRGSNYRMDEIQAAFLNLKLAELNRWIIHREKLAKIYNDFFDSRNIVRPFTADGIRHSFHIYSILVDQRDDLRNFLSEKSIETAIHYPAAISKMEPWSQYYLNSNSNTVGESLSKRFLSLPLSDQHSEEEIFEVIDAIEEFLAR